ncbi:MAG: PASTA domain-containing protein [Candidatus Hydrogenedentota bacterium]|nr:PASTA domain-containing protein [Candidatus Sumerlaea chitinivorans]RMH29152.1 MAG: PASTA domain-containing protein [Candidatus Hydrogenedentota bacterium]GIX43896.1 MAG: hypothetical protein KatS3mg130_0304 [Candidatus Sumerlaea sp.]
MKKKRKPAKKSGGQRVSFFRLFARERGRDKLVESSEAADTSTPDATDSPGGSAGSETAESATSSQMGSEAGEWRVASAAERSSDTLPRMPALTGLEVAPGPETVAAPGPEVQSAPKPQGDRSGTPGRQPPQDVSGGPRTAARQGFARARAAEARRGKRRPPTPYERVERERRLRPRSEGGFFSFVFGLIGLIIRMTIVTVLVGALGAFVGYEVVRAYVRTPEVVVPNVKGMKVQDAFDALAQKKLGLLKERAEPNAIVAPGEIIEQKPPAGSKAKEGTVVRVVVSSGRANYIVPDVVGETRENAINKIRGAGLEVGNITYMESDTAPRDSVISQNPEANKGLEQPMPVHLLVSAGPPGTAFPMPDVTGKLVSEARQILQNSGLTNIQVEPAGAEGTIVSQDPPVGKSVLPSQTVVLRVK